MEESVKKGKTCAYCKQTINSIDEYVTCSSCSAILHEQCWVDNTGCNTFACHGSAIKRTSTVTAGNPAVVQRPKPQPTPLEQAMPHIPVWAPNPAVPLVARILAYLFAFMMVLSAFLSFSLWRPVSVPENVTTWEKPYTSSLGYSIPYPEKWKVISQEEYIRRSGTEDDYSNAPDLFIVPSSEVSIYVIPISADDTSPSPNEYMKYTRYIELPHNSGDTRDAGFNEFTYTKKERHGELPLRIRTINMHGSWAVRDSNGKRLLIVGSAPQEGWEVMSGIFTHMFNEMKATK